uniref:CSON015503 protein n=1 Tax=Culicoides sonorensis TaxID=179676 RepID=A0A336M1K0_CULSO
MQINKFFYYNYYKIKKKKYKMKVGKEFSLKLESKKNEKCVCVLAIAYYMTTFQKKTCFLPPPAIVLKININCINFFNMNI